MIEVRGCGRDDYIVIVMLQIHQLVRQQACVVIVDQSYGSNYRGVGWLDCRADQFVANDVAERFRAICIPLSRDKAVESA